MEEAELFKFIKSIGDYVVEHKIENLIFLDKSSRPAYIGVKQYLRDFYPEYADRVKIFFINPRGFKIENYFQTPASENASMIWNSREKKLDDITERFEEIYHHLISRRDKPTLIFDTCIHTGSTFDAVEKVFNNVGFSNVDYGTVTERDKDCDTPMDLVIDGHALRGCYPFHHDPLIERNFDVVSKKTDIPEDKIKGYALRKEILDIMKRYGAGYKEYLKEKEQSD